MYTGVLKFALLIIALAIVTGIVTEGFRVWIGLQMVDPDSKPGGFLIGAVILTPVGGLLLIGWVVRQNILEGDPRHWANKNDGGLRDWWRRRKARKLRERGGGPIPRNRRNTAP